ncbi:signal transducer and activator of transcription 1-alpha/beta-like isoform X1 [Arapaima gigas]
MTQWEQLQQLDSLYLQKVDELYSQEVLPMDVRHYLAQWIESQDWERASQDPAVASVLFQVLLEELDNQHSRFVQEGKTFLQQCKFRRFKHNFQKYQEQPHTLASVILWFLMKEREILQSAQLAEQVQLLQVQQSSLETDNQKNIDSLMSRLKTKVQGMEHKIKSLEEQQDEFDFKYQTRMMEGGNANNRDHSQQMKILQQLLNGLDRSRKTLMSDLAEVLDLAEQMLTVLVSVELPEWQRRQQKSCIGAREDVQLNWLENWFTCEADCLFQVRKFLKKVEELTGKVSYDNDPFKTQKPALQNRVDFLLTTLLKSALVVESQPCMPQGKGPLVLRTNVQFSVKIRLLVKVPELNHVMKVTVLMDRYRRFNVLGNSTKALNMIESNNGGMVADFRHLTLKEQKVVGGGKGVNDLSLCVTEELHIMCFETVFELHGLSVKLQASSFPVVVISGSGQLQSAWASILWFNMLCTDPTNIGFFASPPAATWPQLAEMLSWQFLSITDKGLNCDQLNMIAQKLFGQQQSYDACRISWAKFSKENVPNVNFSFYVWFDGILMLVKNYLENLWNDGHIMGFVSKGKEKALLKKMQPGTFLLRFSESIKDGGITFSWVEYFDDGKPNIRTVQPFTKVDLTQIPFTEIIRNFQILEAENVPENPLKFLYPNIPKDDAFRKYYTEKSGAESPYFKYIKTKLVFVSKENTLEVKAPMNLLDEPEFKLPMNGLLDIHGEEPPDVLLSSDDLMREPLLLEPGPVEPLCSDISDFPPVPEELQTSLQEILNGDPMILSSDFLSLDQPLSQSAFSPDLSPQNHTIHAPLYS